MLKYSINEIAAFRHISATPSIRGGVDKPNCRIHWSTLGDDAESRQFNSRTNGGQRPINNRFKYNCGEWPTTRVVLSLICILCSGPLRLLHRWWRTNTKQEDNTSLLGHGVVSDRGSLKPIQQCSVSVTRSSRMESVVAVTGTTVHGTGHGRPRI